ncbi:MAG: peptidylprolyl isomerase [Rickettsiales bacterium]|nr:peptidylprolyl isomerase [Rickettsiales bacterium]
MKNFLKILSSTILFFLISHNNILGKDKPIIFLVLDSGIVKIQTFPEKAPNTVKRILELSNSGFYDGLTFHRVIAGFMAQGGDPNGNGTGGSGQSIKAEFNDLKHERGIVSMARSQDPDSADSQFFICYDSHDFLDGKYTIWGKVIEGMNLIDRIPEGKGQNGQVLKNPTKIISMRVKNK